MSAERHVATGTVGTVPASRRGRIVRGLAALVCGQGIRSLGHVLLVPLYLRYWSVSAYGEWLALSSLAQYLSTCDLGVNTAGVNRLTQEYARGNLAAYARYQASALAFYVVVAGGGSVALALAAWAFPVSDWLGLRAIPPAHAAWITWLLGVSVLLAMPVGFMTAIYRTMGHVAWTAWLGNLRSVAAFALVPIVLGLGAGMPTLAAWQVAPLVLATGFVVWHGSRRWPALMPRPTAARLSALRTLMGPSLLFAAMTLATAVSLQGTVLLVVTQLGGAAVAVFVTSRTLTSIVRQVVFTINNAIWPHLTALEATGDYARLRRFHRHLVLGSTVLSTAAAAALWQVGPQVIALWTGGNLVADVALLHALLVQVVLQAPWMASSIFPVAFNRPQTVAAASMVSSVVGLSVGSVLIQRYGVAAVPIGLIVGEALACYVFVPRAACRLIGADYRRCALQQVVDLSVGVAAAFSAGWAMARIAVGPLVVQWLEVGAATLAASMLAAWAVGLERHDRWLLVGKGRASLVRLGLLPAG